MEKKDGYKINVSIRPAGGNASKSAVRGSINIPKDIIKDMRLTTDDCGIIITYDDNKKEMTIRKDHKV